RAGVVDRGDAVEVGLGQLAAAQGAGAHPLLQPGDAGLVEGEGGDFRCGGGIGSAVGRRCRPAGREQDRGEREWQAAHVRAPQRRKREASPVSRAAATQRRRTTRSRASTHTTSRFTSTTTASSLCRWVAKAVKYNRRSQGDLL